MFQTNQLHVLFCVTLDIEYTHHPSTPLKDSAHTNTQSVSLIHTQTSFFSRRHTHTYVSHTLAHTKNLLNIRKHTNTLSVSLYHCSLGHMLTHAHTLTNSLQYTHTQSEMRNVTWAEILVRLKQAQRDHKMNIRKQDLTELGNEHHTHCCSLVWLVSSFWFPPWNIVGLNSHLLYIQTPMQSHTHTHHKSQHFQSKNCQITPYTLYIRPMYHYMCVHVLPTSRCVPPYTEVPQLSGGHDQQGRPPLQATYPLLWRKVSVVLVHTHKCTWYNVYRILCV